LIHLKARLHTLLEEELQKTASLEKVFSSLKVKQKQLGSINEASFEASKLMENSHEYLTKYVDNIANQQNKLTTIFESVKLTQETKNKEAQHGNSVSILVNLSVFVLGFVRFVLLTIHFLFRQPKRSFQIYNIQSIRKFKEVIK